MNETQLWKKTSTVCHHWRRRTDQNTSSPSSTRRHLLLILVLLSLIRARTALDLSNLGLDTLLPLVLAQLLLAKPLRLGLVLLLRLLLSTLLVVIVGLLERVLADLLVRVRVQLLEPVGLDLVVDVALELALVPLLVVVRQRLHVLGHVAGEDVLAQRLGVQLLGLDVVAREALFGMGDVQTAVGGALHRAKDTGAGRGAHQSDVEVALEWTAALAVDLGFLSQLVLSIRLLDTGKGLVEVELLEGAAGEQQADRVGGGPVSETVSDAVALQLVAVGAREDLVAGDLRGDDLGDDVAVGEADDQAVLGRVVLVLGLGDEPLAGVVVGLTRSATLVLDLEAAGGILSGCILSVTDSRKKTHEK